MTYVYYGNELYHHGIIGQKWGVRRYQNADGTLTDAGKKRISKQYGRTASKVTKKLSRRADDMYIDSHNAAADVVNAKIIEAKDHKVDQKELDEIYDRIFTQTWDESLAYFYDSDKDAIKSRELVEKYNMTSFDECAKRNTEAIESVFESVGRSSIH